MTFNPTSFAKRNSRSRLSRWYLPSCGSPTFHSTQVRTVLKPSSFIFDRSCFQRLDESGVIVSSIGARALPPLYHTATGKKLGSRSLLWLRWDCFRKRPSPDLAIRFRASAGPSTPAAIARITNNENFLGTVQSGFGFWDRLERSHCTPTKANRLGYMYVRLEIVFIANRLSSPFRSMLMS